MSGTTYQGAQAFYTTLYKKFNNGNTNNLFGLDQFDGDDTEALVLGAKMSLFQINLLQQLIMLGSAHYEDTMLKTFAATAAGKLQERYNYLTSIDRLRGLVNMYTTFTNGSFGQMGGYRCMKAPIAVCSAATAGSRLQAAISCDRRLMLAFGIAFASESVAHVPTQKPTMAACLRCWAQYH